MHSKTRYEGMEIITRWGGTLEQSIGSAKKRRVFLPGLDICSFTGPKLKNICDIHRPTFCHLNHPFGYRRPVPFVSLKYLQQHHFVSYSGVQIWVLSSIRQIKLISQETGLNTEVYGTLGWASCLAHVPYCAKTVGRFLGSGETVEESMML